MFRTSCIAPHNRSTSLDAKVKTLTKQRPTAPDKTASVAQAHSPIGPTANCTSKAAPALGHIADLQGQAVGEGFATQGQPPALAGVERLHHQGLPLRQRRMHRLLHLQAGGLLKKAADTPTLQAGRPARQQAFGLRSDGATASQARN
jgi:hypothetical protein